MRHWSSRGAQPIVAALSAFDRDSGSLFERFLFNHRLAVVLVCAVATLLLGLQAMQLRLDTGSEKMIPWKHPFIREYQNNSQDLKGLGNAVRLVVETRSGTIFERPYIEALQRINDAALFLPGVDRAAMRSLWTPIVRWTAVVEGGLEGGPVMPDGFDGSPASLRQLQLNVARSGEVGRLVAANYKSSIVLIPLLERDPDTGKALDYRHLSDALEQLRHTYNSREIQIHIVGFAKVLGDLIDGLRQIALFFVVTLVVAAAMLYLYTRCARSTALVLSCSLIAVVWQLGLYRLLGHGLDPFSILVPFLVCSIGISHGAQKMNGIMQDIGRGTHRLIAARYTFRRLFLAGLTALLCDAIGFAILAMVDIRAIQDLAVMASIGVSVLVFTNLILLPVLLSYSGVNPTAAARSLRKESLEGLPWAGQRLWRGLANLTRMRGATLTVIVAVLLGGLGVLISLHLKVGDLDPGAPELKPQSRYNRDDAFTVRNYAASSDLFVVMVKTPANQCVSYDVLSRVDALEYQLQQLPGVQSTNSLAALAKRTTVGLNEGSLKWFELVPNQSTLNTVATRAPRELFNQNCDLLSVLVYLRDHRADTLAQVVASVQQFASQYDTSDVRFSLAAGDAGIEAARNIVVQNAMHVMLLWVFGAVGILCLIAFRSWRAMLVAILPLVLTSILGEALMVLLGIGVKVATLPVVALGVGIGVDYALYILSIMLVELRAGAPLEEAYYGALLFTGRIVVLTGATLATGVASWTLSPIKFQTDMGVLLTFMFLWNMLGALLLIPALSRFLLVPSRRIATTAHSASVGALGGRPDGPIRCRE